MAEENNIFLRQYPAKNLSYRTGVPLIDDTSRYAQWKNQSGLQFEFEFRWSYADRRCGRSSRKNRKGGRRRVQSASYPDFGLLIGCSSSGNPERTGEDVIHILVRGIVYEVGLDPGADAGGVCIPCEPGGCDR